MKSLNHITLFALVSLLIGCNKTDGTNALNSSDIQEAPLHQIPVMMTLVDAEKILGEPSHISDSTLTIKDEVNQYLLTFTANQPDISTGKTGNLYYMYEQYDQAALAHQSYTSIKKSNENHHGVQVLQDVGDEAYFHSDGQNFYFILIRKGSIMIRMKVNKITSKTSVEQFNAVARSIVSALGG